MKNSTNTNGFNIFNFKICKPSIQWWRHLNQRLELIGKFKRRKLFGNTCFNLIGHISFCLDLYILVLTIQRIKSTLVSIQIIN